MNSMWWACLEQLYDFVLLLQQVSLLTLPVGCLEPIKGLSSCQA